MCFTVLGARVEKHLARAIIFPKFLAMQAQNHGNAMVEMLEAF